MTTEFNDESSGAGVQPDPVGDAHGADGGQPELFPLASEGSAGVDPEAEPGVEPEIRELP